MFRIESDSMGEVKVPHEAYYGAQTQRAIENFRISHLKISEPFIRALGLLKKHSAMTNLYLGLLEKRLAETIIQASREMIEGRFDDQFPVDVFQTGSGTSSNMNANEILAGRANEILTGKRGGKAPVHPNDHVNMGQSSNDVIPSAIHIAALSEISNNLLPAITVLKNSLQAKSEKYGSIRKMGRTHLQDAVLITLGQEFSGYARQMELGFDRIRKTENSLAELALGGTAVGTGINTNPVFASKVINGIAEETGLPFRETENHFEAQASRDAVVETSAALKTLAVSLTKIANDIRWLASGPRCGLGEINIPPLQPGSSIMPGKVNPVIPEVVIQIAAQIIGNDATITICGQSGNFELNAMMPLIAYNLLQSINILKNGIITFNDKCITGISVNKDRCESCLEKSLALATVFAPIIGYDKASFLAMRAYEEGKTIRETAIQMGILPKEEIDRLIDEAIQK